MKIMKLAKIVKILTIIKLVQIAKVCTMYIVHVRGPTEDIISYFTLVSSEIHYYDIVEKMGSWTLMSSEV